MRRRTTEYQAQTLLTELVESYRIEQTSRFQIEELVLSSGHLKTIHSAERPGEVDMILAGLSLFVIADITGAPLLDIRGPHGLRLNPSTGHHLPHQAVDRRRVEELMSEIAATPPGARDRFPLWRTPHSR
jgi:hypothetical protein